MDQAINSVISPVLSTKFFVGMHNESTFKRTNRLGAFVCFKAAEEGGEFLLCDGRAMFRDVEPALL